MIHLFKIRTFLILKEFFRRSLSVFSNLPYSLEKISSIHYALGKIPNKYIPKQVNVQNVHPYC